MLYTIYVVFHNECMILYVFQVVALLQLLLLPDFVQVQLVADIAENSNSVTLSELVESAE